MESLHSYIMTESEFQELTDYFMGMFKDITGGAKDIVSVIKTARAEKKDADKDKKTKEVERILFELLDDEEFYNAITHNEANEYDIRRMLKQKLSRKDTKYIPDIINYLDEVKAKS